MLLFSFPTLTPAVWLNQSDRLWVPGESLSLSAVPFLLKFTLSVTNSFWHLSKCRALCSTALYGLFTLTHMRPHHDYAHKGRWSTCHTQCYGDAHRYTGTHTNSRICKDINRMWLKSRIPSSHILCLTPHSPRYFPRFILSAYSNSSHA